MCNVPFGSDLPESCRTMGSRPSGYTEWYERAGWLDTTEVGLPVCFLFSLLHMNTQSQVLPPGTS